MEDKWVKTRAMQIKIAFKLISISPSLSAVE